MAIATGMSPDAPLAKPDTTITAYIVCTLLLYTGDRARSYAVMCLGALRCIVLSLADPYRLKRQSRKYSL